MRRATLDDAVLTTRILSFTIQRNHLLTALLVFFFLCSLGFFAAMAYTVLTGIGLWGNNIPVAWSFAITNYVWWIGIGIAGTFISTSAYLLRQWWRTSINRLAESMTLFAVANALIFPILHLGRPWFFYWLLPYPARTHVWPQFRSSLTWDTGMIVTYFIVSVMFWYLGLIPDLAAARDALPGPVRRRVFAILALGWRGTARQWAAHKRTTLLLAGIATPLVVGVHSVVGLDFAIGLESGWHSTMFPPYFVVGALMSGFAMLLTMAIPVRWAFGLEDVVSPKHLDVIARIILALSLVVTWFYCVETYLAAIGHDDRDRHFSLWLRPFGPFGWWIWITVGLNCVLPQLYWFKRVRRSTTVLFVTSVLINVGLWLERFDIIAPSLARDFLPSSWMTFHPSWMDFILLGGSVSFFVFLFLLVLRFVPFIPISELREERHE